jgi:protease-4
VIFLVVSIALFVSTGGEKRGGSVGSSFFGSEAIGVIELNGVIVDSKKILAKLEKFDEDAGIKGVVIRLNSPGGAVAPSQEIYQAVRKMKKPVVASMSSVAASGAYYVACATKKIFANPGTITGSIGVIMEFANLEKLYEWAKIRRYVVKTGKFKDSGSEFRDMTAEEKALFQAMVDDVLSQFKKAVADGRKLPMEKVTPLADGRIFSGQQAKNAKLVDELGSLQDAIDEVAKMANIKGKPKVVYPDKRKSRLLDLLLGDLSDDDADAESRSGSVLTRFLGSLMGREAGENPVTGLRPGIYWLWSGAR